MLISSQAYVCASQLLTLTPTKSFCIIDDTLLFRGTVHLREFLKDHAQLMSKVQYSNKGIEYSKVKRMINCGPHLMILF